MSYVDSILLKDEIVVQKAKVTKLVLVGIWVKAILLCWLIIPLIKAIIFTIIVTKIELALTNQRLVGRVGVVSRQIMDSKLDKVQTVDIAETFWGRIFKYANIVVTTAGSKFVFQGIARAAEFKQLVMNQISEYEDDKVQKQAQALAGAMNK
jgi:uncharacterized membrane protein YdbT with pleckstrin-like domain